MKKIKILTDSCSDLDGTLLEKYDIDYALKRDKSTEPPTYHVFFSAANTESFKRAFSENGAAFLPASHRT